MALFGGIGLLICRRRGQKAGTTRASSTEMATARVENDDDGRGSHGSQYGSAPNDEYGVLSLKNPDNQSAATLGYTVLPSLMGANSSNGGTMASLDSVGSLGTTSASAGTTSEVSRHY